VRTTLPALLVAALVPVAILYGCGGSNSQSNPSDAGPGTSTIEASAEGGAHEAAADAAPEAAAEAGYVNKAPHCVASDAGIPAPFSAGAIPDVSALAQVQQSGGKVLSHPTFVSVTFPGDTSADELVDFTASVGCTAYWHAITADYGVGEGIAAPPVTLTEAAPSTIDDTGIRSWLKQKIDGGDPKFPKPKGDVVYVLWYPASTTITLQGTQSCSGWGGYHEGGQLADGTPFSYAVVPRCQAPGGGSVMDGLTITASHELIEACTDPQPDAAPAYAAPDPNHLGWLLASASEVGDLCEFDQSAAYLPPSYPWYVQRSYSNSFAAKGANPCVPQASPTYFYGSPLVPDQVSLDLLGTGTPVQTAVVKVPVGSSVTIPVKLAGPASVTSMQVQAIDLAQLTGQPSTLSLSLSAASGAPGSTLQLTIKKTAASPQAQGGVSGFAVVTTNGQDQTFQLGLSSD
jgi:hypothetical protein